MTDLHCHVLPGIDDGAADPETSRLMMRAQLGDGIDKIALTSHFNCEYESVEHFVSARGRALARLNAMISASSDISDIKLKTASETMFSPALSNEGLRSLCIEDTDYLLIELPTEHKPYYLRETLYRLQSQGIIPILAHIERYQYFMNYLDELKVIVDTGVCTQINSASIYGGGRTAKLMLKLIECRLVTVVASDAHSIGKRHPDLKKGMDTVRHVLGDETASYLCANADAVFEGDVLGAVDTAVPRKIFGRYI